MGSSSCALWLECSCNVVYHHCWYCGLPLWDCEPSFNPITTTTNLHSPTHFIMTLGSTDKLGLQLDCNSKIQLQTESVNTFIKVYPASTENLYDFVALGPDQLPTNLPKCRASIEFQIIRSKSQERPKPTDLRQWYIMDEHSSARDSSCMCCILSSIIPHIYRFLASPDQMRICLALSWETRNTGRSHGRQ